MGWEIFPDGLANILTRINREYTPKAIVVTESGAAFDDRWDGNHSVHDQQRVDYLAGAHSNRCPGHTPGCTHQGLHRLVLPG